MDNIIYIVFEGEYGDVYVSLVTTDQDKAIKESLDTERKQIELWKNERRIGEYGLLTSDSFNTYEEVKKGIEKILKDLEN